jgi:predicted Zn-dependent peptidase
MLFFRNNILEFHELLKNFELVTIDDIQRVASELFDWKKMKVVLVGDYSKKSKLGNEIYQTIVNSFEPKAENGLN